MADSPRPDPIPDGLVKTTSTEPQVSGADAFPKPADTGLVPAPAPEDQFK